MIDFKSEYRKRQHALRDAKAVVEGLEVEVQKLFKKSIEQDLAVAHAANLDEVLMTPQGLNIAAILSFLCEDVDCETAGFKGIPIGIQGNGPWQINNFDVFLTNKGFLTGNILDDEVQYLVLGSLQVSSEELMQKIDWAISENKELKIYTQELFVSWLITGKDPLATMSNESLYEVVSFHEPMQLILNHESFSWPIISHYTDIDDEDGSVVGAVTSVDWDGLLSEQSPLKKIGYTVRENALSISERQSLLEIAFKTERLEQYLTTEADKSRWGRSNSAQRLYAISSLIGWLANFQGANKPAALEKWSMDLNWLKRTFYDGRMRFKWPNTTNTLKPLVQKLGKNRPTTKGDGQGVKTVLNPAASWPFPSGRRP